MASSSPFQIQQAPSSIPLFTAWGFLLLPEGLQQASLFWCWLAYLQSPLSGECPQLSGSRHSQLPAPNGDLAVLSIPRSKISCVEERLRYLGIAISWIVQLCPIKSILVSSWQFLGDSLLEGVSDSKYCFKMLMNISLIPVLWLLL